jgi:hypothetical protein
VVRILHFPWTPLTQHYQCYHYHHHLITSTSATTGAERRRRVGSNGSTDGIAFADDPAARLLLMQMTIKSADISHPIKPLRLHLVWSDRIIIEFFRQGDRERAIGLPLSPLCDFENFNLPRAQKGFITFVVRPCVELWADFVDGTYINSSGGSGGGSSSGSSGSGGGGAAVAPAEEEGGVAVQLHGALAPAPALVWRDNLQRNFDHWVDVETRMSTAVIQQAVVPPGAAEPTAIAARRGSTYLQATRLLDEDAKAMPLLASYLQKQRESGLLE